MPPDFNRTVLYPPQKWKIEGELNPTYKCGPPIRVSPMEFPDPSGLMSDTIAVASWQVGCNITRPTKRNSRYVLSQKLNFNYILYICILSTNNISLCHSTGVVYPSLPTTMTQCCHATPVHVVAQTHLRVTQTHNPSSSHLMHSSSPLRIVLKRQWLGQSSSTGISPTLYPVTIIVV